MATGKAVKAEGRLVYIEPNNLREELGIGFGNGDNIAWNPEDLSISVDLQVIIPNRDSCGVNVDNDYVLTNISFSDNGIYKKWQSFFSGTELNGKENEDNFLTTNYTDISYQEIIDNKAGSKEALGIKSIDIQFDSHFFPIVKIKMTDVRGASLMMPEEQGFTDMAKGERARTCESFFNALFHFPYPRFALSIKGFYGNRVTFMLSVNDFKSTFNASTGDFDIDIEFIGHMYGLYTDLPFSCIFIAPYLGSKGEEVNSYWASQIGENGAFHFSDGTAIPTFKEFLISYDKMADTYKEKYEELGSDYQKIGNAQKLRQESDLLKSVRKDYSEFIKDVETNNSDSYITSITNDKEYALFFKNNKIALPDSGKIKDHYYLYLDSIGNGNGVVTEQEIDSIQWGKIVSIEKIFTGDGELLLPDYFGGVSESFVEKLKDVGKDYKDKYVYYFKKDEDFLNKIDTRLSVLDDDVDKAYKDATEEINDLTKNVLGFVPNVENVFRMIFAHIDAFMTKFYEVLAEINKQKLNGSRTLDKVRGVRLSEIDVDSNGSNKCFIPPFVGVYKNNQKDNKRVRVFPGDINGISSFPEVTFVNDIIDAINAVKGSSVKENTISSDEVDTAGDKSMPSSIDAWTRISLAEINNDGNNPYREYKGKIEDVDGWVRFFYKRVANLCAKDCSMLISNMNERVDAEVGNFWNVWGQTIINSSSLDKIKAKISTYTYPADMGEQTKVTKEKGFKLVKDKGNYANLVIKNNLYTDFSYPTQSRFYGGVYPRSNNSFKNMNASIADAKNNPDAYRIYMVQQGSDKKGDNIRHNFIGNEHYNDKKANAIEFLSCLVGDNKAYLYPFDETTTEIRRIPKYLALFYGGIQWFNNSAKVTGASTCVKNTFLVDTNGISASFLLTDVKREKLNPEIWNETDRQRDFQEMFESWATNDYETLKETLKIQKDKITIDKVQVDVFDTDLSSDGKSSTRDLINFYTETIDVLHIVPNEGIAAFEESYVNRFLDGVKKKIEEYSNKKNTATTGNGGNTSTDPSSTESAEAKKETQEQLYYTLKNLYDKWISTYSVNRFKLKTAAEDRRVASDKSRGILNGSETVSEFQSFIFMDTFYNDIKDIYMIDPKTVYDMVEKNKGENVNRSVIQFITDLAFGNNLNFIALPVFNNFYSTKTIADIFTPKSIYDGSEKSGRAVGNTYILMYSHEPSHMLNIRKSNKNDLGYPDDVLDIADVAGNINPEVVNILQSNNNNSSNGYTVPAFGVTFAKQNQMYFKGLSIGMDNPRETEEAIANRLRLADQESAGAGRSTPTTVGQNLYSIYSNRQYDCSVDMMGCANIMPMMYFQLNNVPIFRGGYRIYSVKHHIENGDMTTSFVGTRIAKNAIPYSTNVIDMEALLNKIKQQDTQEKTQLDTPFTLNGEAVRGNNVDFTSIKDGSIFKLGSNGVAEKYNSPSQVNDKGTCDYNVANLIAAFKQTNPKMNVGENYTEPSIYENTASLHRCATAVKIAVKAAFSGTSYENVWTGGYNGYECYKILQELKFYGIKVFEGDNLREQINNFSKNFEPGDIAVIETYPKPIGSDYGHVCAYCGNGVWVSDHNQSKAGLLTYRSEAMIKHILVYRYSGNRIMPEWFRKIIFINKNADAVGITYNGKPINKEMSIANETLVSYVFYLASKKKITSIVVEQVYNNGTTEKVGEGEYTYSFDKDNGKLTLTVSGGNQGNGLKGNIQVTVDGK